MKAYGLHFKINQLRQDKIILALEAITIFILALFISIMLPSLLIRYVYANQQLLEQPKILEYIPLTAFVVGIGFFAFALFQSIAKKRKIMKLERELEEIKDNDYHHGEMKNMDRIVDKMMTSKSSRKSTARKRSTKRSTSKKS